MQQVVNALIPLSQGKLSIVDEGDFERISQFKWLAHFDKHSRKWIARRVKQICGIRKRIVLHRFILNAPSDKQIDHINGNTLDNRQENLRLCTHPQNQRNKKITKGTSLYKGVCIDRYSNSWISAITVNRKRIFLGRFNTEIEAAKAYDEAAPIYHKDFACTNKMMGLL